MMKNELDQVMRLMEEFEDRVEAVDYAIHNLVTHATFSTLNAFNKKNLGSWFWLSGADLFLYSPEQLRALGYRRHEIIEKIDHRYFSNKIHPDDMGDFSKRFNRLLNGQFERETFECRFQSKDGTYKRFVTSIEVVKQNKDGKPLVLEGKVYMKFSG